MSLEHCKSFCERLRRVAGEIGRIEPRDAALARFAELLVRLERRLASPLRIVVLGEINSGKSSLVNLLLGQSVVPTSVAPNTRLPTLFRYADTPMITADLGGGHRLPVAWSEANAVLRLPVRVLEFGLPVERLRLFEIMDTPGMANPELDPYPFAAECSAAHLAMWCTVATQAWRESERRAWAGLPKAMRSTGLLVVTRIDCLPRSSDLPRILKRLSKEASGLFKEIVPISILAAAASGSGAGRDRAAWERAGGATLEMCAARALTDISRRRLGSTARAIAASAARNPAALKLARLHFDVPAEPEVPRVMQAGQPS